MYQLQKSIRSNIRPLLDIDPGALSCRETRPERPRVARHAVGLSEVPRGVWQFVLLGTDAPLSNPTRNVCKVFHNLQVLF